MCEGKETAVYWEEGIDAETMAHKVGFISDALFHLLLPRLALSSALLRSSSSYFSYELCGRAAARNTPVSSCSNKRTIVVVVVVPLSFFLGHFALLRPLKPLFFSPPPPSVGLGWVPQCLIAKEMGLSWHELFFLFGLGCFYKEIKSIEKKSHSQTFYWTVNVELKNREPVLVPL